LNDMPRGLAFGRLALKASDLFDARDIRGRISMVLGGFILRWNGRLTDTLPHFSEGAKASLDAGDLEFHGYNRYATASYSFMSGTPLDKVADLLDEGYAAVLEHKHKKTQRVFRMAKQAVHELRGRAANPPAEEIPFDEAAAVAYWRERDRMALAYYYKYRTLKQFMVCNVEDCVASARVIEENSNVVMGMAFSAYYLPYQSLALIRLLPKMAASQQCARSAAISVACALGRGMPRELSAQMGPGQRGVGTGGRARVTGRARLSGGDRAGESSRRPAGRRASP
jgi:predicted ATPase